VPLPTHFFTLELYNPPFNRVPTPPGKSRIFSEVSWTGEVLEIKALRPPKPWNFLVA